MTLLDIARKKGVTIQKVSEEIKQLTGVDIGWDPTQIISNEIVQRLLPTNIKRENKPHRTIENTEIRNNKEGDKHNAISQETNQKSTYIINSDDSDLVAIVKETIAKGLVVTEMNTHDRIILDCSNNKGFKVKKGFIVGLELIEVYEDEVDSYNIKYAFSTVNEWQQYKIKQASESHSTLRGHITTRKEYRGYLINVFGILATLNDENQRMKEHLKNRTWLNVRITKAYYNDNTWQVEVEDVKSSKDKFQNKKDKTESSLQSEYDQLVIDSVVDVVIEQINEKSIFVKYKNLRGLIFGSDMFWAYVKFNNHVSEGDTIQVKVVEKNVDDNGRFNVRFSHKECLPNPWEEIIFEDFQMVEGPVIRVDDRGALIKIGEGIEGFLHIKDMSKMEYEALKQWEPSCGNVNVFIKAVNTAQKSISLTTSEDSYEIENKWISIIQNYEVNKVYRAKVIMHDETFLWVQLEEGIEASIHKNELSWSRTQGNNLDSYQMNDDVTILIKNIDSNKRVIKASIRALLPNPWETASISLKTGDICNVEVIEKKDNFLIVETLDSFHLIGSIKMSEISWSPLKPEDEPQVRWKMPAKIMIFHPNRQILKLSVRNIEEDPWNSLYPGAEVYGKIQSNTNSALITVKLDNELLAKTPETELISYIGKRLPFKIISSNRASQEIIVSHNCFVFDKRTEEIIKSFFNN